MQWPVWHATAGVNLHTVCFLDSWAGPVVAALLQPTEQYWQECTCCDTPVAADWRLIG